ncbi:membrane-bound transcription factor site-2 protease [Tachypleus tridentatus]|uniref:membrane-bound transcription factor site-2 protease n=1 Tax=Tachypleus tridentatus TaxID=6853 RepID=UPI003FD3A260
MFPFAFIIVILFWIVVGFFDTVFKSCMLHPYIVLLKDWGLTIKPFQLQLYSTSWNRTVHTWGRFRPKLLRRWFEVGALVSLVCLLPSLWLVISTIKSLLWTKEYEQQNSQVLQPVMPGINLPLSDILYYLMTLLVCSVIHEIGHALAAVRANVRIQGCGLFIFGIFPGAFVDLPTEHVSMLSAWQQLQLFCAGVWHNMILAGIAGLLLLMNPYFASLLYQSDAGVSVISVDQVSHRIGTNWQQLQLFCAGVWHNMILAGIAGLLLLMNPYFASLLYQSDAGVSVISVDQSSGIFGPTGLVVEDKVTMINGCAVRNEEMWRNCLVAVASKPPVGYCVGRNFLELENKQTLVGRQNSDCCGNISESQLCFVEEVRKHYYCLRVRKMLTEFPHTCNSSSPCQNAELVCLNPLLENITRLISVTREDRNSVLFVGQPAEIYSAVGVSDWIPKFYVMPSRVIHGYETFLKYLVSFSGALAILNLIPCFHLDGQWIAQTIIDAVFPMKNYRNIIGNLVVYCGTCLLGSTVFLGLWSLCQQ